MFCGNLLHVITLNIHETYVLVKPFGDQGPQAAIFCHERASRVFRSYEGFTNNKHSPISKSHGSSLLVNQKPWKCNSQLKTLIGNLITLGYLDSIPPFMIVHGADRTAAATLVLGNDHTDTVGALSGSFSTHWRAGAVQDPRGRQITLAGSCI